MSSQGAIAQHPAGLLLSPIDARFFDVQAFRCGDGLLACPEINEFLKMRAHKEHKEKASTTYILHDGGSAEIYAYVTTAMGTIRYKANDTYHSAGALHVAYVGRSALHQ